MKVDWWDIVAFIVVGGIASAPLWVAIIAGGGFE